MTRLDDNVDTLIEKDFGKAGLVQRVMVGLTCLDLQELAYGVFFFSYQKFLSGRASSRRCMGGEGSRHRGL